MFYFKKIIKKVGLGLLALIPGVALAQTANVFEPVSGDKAMLVLQSIFGNLGVFGSSGTDSMVAVIQAFNGAILTLGGIFAAYTILAGTLGTAHDGEMLGKKFSSVWVPIRYALGTALVLPLIGGGYCVMQLIVGWLIVQGIGLADIAWSSFVSTSNLPKVTATSLSSVNSKKLGYDVFQSMVCEDVIQLAIKNSPDWMYKNASIGTTTIDSTLSTTYQFGDINSTGMLKPDSCGTVTISKYQVPASTGLSISPIAQILNAADSISRMQTIMDAHKAQTDAMIASMKAQADMLVSSGASIDSSGINSAIASYNQAVGQTASNAILAMQDNTELSNSASQDGFINAGAFYDKISALQGLVQRTAAAVPSSSGPANFTDDNLSDVWRHYIPIVQKTLNQTDSNMVTFGVGNEPGGSNTSSLSNLKEFLTSGFDPQVLFKKAVSEIGTSPALNNGENPIVSSKTIGDWVLMVASGALVFLGTTSITIGNATGIGLLIQTVTQMFISPAFVVGFLLSDFLPMLPYYIWTGAVLGWLLMACEALIAAPLWAVMHLNPHGDDLTGSAGNGYRLVLGLLLRPVLMVFGLCLSILITQIYGTFINSVFADVFLLSQTTSNIFVLIFNSIIAQPLLYCGMMLMFVTKMFSLIHVLPDQFLNWIGGGGPQLGGFAEHMGGEKGFAAMGAGAALAGRGVDAMQETKRQNAKDSASGKTMKDVTTQKSGINGGSAGSSGASQVGSGGGLPMARTTAGAGSSVAGSGQDTDIDNELGTGASDILNNAGSGSGLASVRNKSALRDAVSAVGGKDSAGAKNLFDEISKQQIDSKGKPFSDIIKDSMKSIKAGGEQQELDLEPKIDENKK